MTDKGTFLGLRIVGLKGTVGMGIFHGVCGRNWVG